MAGEFNSNVNLDIVVHVIFSALNFFLLSFYRHDDVARSGVRVNTTVHMKYRRNAPSFCGSDT